jgi:CspA family cold shock protein
VADGTVKWSNTRRALGLIVSDDLSYAVFACFSSIGGSGCRELTVGQRVTFDPEPGDKGLHTTRARSLETGRRRLRRLVCPLREVRSP